MHRVNLTDKSPFFMIPGQQLHLTWEHPGPIEVDLSKWNSEQIKWLSNAKIKGIVNVQNLNPETPVTVQGIVPPVALSSPQVPLQDKFIAIKKEVMAAAYKLLRAREFSILKAIEKSNDIVQLKILLDLETTGANREKILTPLNHKIGLMSAKLSSFLGPDLDSSAFSKEAGLPDIEDSDVETIVIKTGADDE